MAAEVAQITNGFPSQAITVSAPQATLGDGVVFDPALVASLPAAASNNFSMTPKAMAPAPDPASPWTSKESTITFSLTDNGTNYTHTVTANQTNYAIQANASFDATQNIKMKSTAEQTFDVKSNTQWKLTLTDASSLLASSSHANNAVAGANNTQGGNSTTAFKYTATNGIGSKYATATFKFEDNTTPKRAPDITITAMQCQGTPDVSGLTTATPAQTSGTNTWGTAVVRHQAKAGVYDEFLSADFGTAGRWMTTNLSAKAYDGVAHSAGRTLVQHDASNITANYIKPLWTYPGNHVIGANEQPTPEYNSNFRLGLLYTWDAASAGKGGSTGNLNIDNPAAGNPANNEAGFPYGNGVNSTQKIRQGICPSGWHLPSDLEFTTLENHLNQQTSQYANMDNINGALTAPAPATPANIPIGQAMKDACENGTNSSNPPADGGFNLLLAGMAISGSSSTSEYGDRVLLWSSSSTGAAGNWTRSTNNVINPAGIYL